MHLTISTANRDQLPTLNIGLTGIVRRLQASSRTLLIATMLAVTGVATAMDIEWTRTTGQWPVEASPLVGDFTHSGKNEILILNRGGQLLRWAPDGTFLGPGQDGSVQQLPAGRWTTAPTLVDGNPGLSLISTSVEGLVVGLDSSFQVRWKRKLAGETGWGRAIPTVLGDAASPRFVFGDVTGNVTCLGPDGGILWTNLLHAGPIKAPPQKITVSPGQDGLLVAAGSTLFCLDAAGSVRWRRDLGSEITTRPELLNVAGQTSVFCGTASGSLWRLTPDGSVLWERQTGDESNSNLGYLPGNNSQPLVLCPGVWGNLHAIDADGHIVWTSLFRTKTRAKPMVAPSDSQHRPLIFLPAFNQHLYAFDEQGAMADDLRLSGTLPSAVTPLPDATSGRIDLLVTTTSLLAYRVRISTPKSPYGPTAKAGNVELKMAARPGQPQAGPVIVTNPHGGLIAVQVNMLATNGHHWVMSQITAQSGFEMPLPQMVSTGAWSIVATTRDSAGILLTEKRWELPAPPENRSDSKPPVPISVQPTEPFDAIPNADAPVAPGDSRSDDNSAVTIRNLYIGEADEGAFTISSALNQPVRARVTLTNLVRSDGALFGGTTTLREVVATGSVNGEEVPDALPKLTEGGLISIPAKGSVKIWVSVDAQNAAAGTYIGHIQITPLHGEAPGTGISLRVEVPNLKLPEHPGLSLCTWDYVPNRWFGGTKPVLDDMTRHGVNVFPRTTIPPGSVDVSNQLSIAWAPLDRELDRLNGRGTILFHLNHPPLQFAVTNTPAEQRRLEIAYVRAFRDHLHQRGWNYSQYAFYLLDEPGLDYGQNLSVLLDAGLLIREADPRLRTYTDPVPGLSWRDYERIAPLVDVWAPNMRLVTGLLTGDPRIKQILKSSTVWSYECVSQVKSLSPLRYNRANAWRAKFFGLQGIGFWTHSTTEADHWLAGKTVNDEYALVYPGESPVPSVRWEAVRDGLEDAAALTLLEQVIEKQRANSSKKALIEEAVEAVRIAQRDVMELSDEAFVESRDFLRQGDRVLGHSMTDAKLFRRHRAEIARLTLALSSE